MARSGGAWPRRLSTPHAAVNAVDGGREAGREPPRLPLPWPAAIGTFYSLVFGLAFFPMPSLFLVAMVSVATFALFRFALSHDRQRNWYRLREAAAPGSWGASEDAASARLENRIFRLAYRLGGRLTVSDLVVDTTLTSAEAERVLGDLVDNSRVTIEVRDDGLVFYEFPEIIDRRGRGDDMPLRG